jgi:ubiquinone/menaquinone biosynthesis C-methylase UbiE
VIVHFFDVIAPEYEDWAGGLHRRVAERLVEVAAPRPGEQCLDVGCGTGLVGNAIGHLVADGGQVLGLDVSAGMLDVARRQAPPNALFQRISADPELWFREGSFDLVTFGDSISYLGNPVAALGEARRVLRGGGRAALSVRRRSLATRSRSPEDGTSARCSVSRPSCAASWCTPGSRSRPSPPWSPAAGCPRPRPGST